MEKMLEKVKYSFVLPAYKAKYLREAIDSILNQTYTDFELIIVNDASPEDLESIVDSYNDNRIQYYRNETNMGGTDLVAQWNHSISFAKGEYLILASDDDIYSPEYLQRMDVMIRKYPDTNVFRPRVKRIDRNGKILSIDGFVSEYMTRLEYMLAWTNRWILSGIPFFIFKREALMAIGGFVNYPLAWFSDDATVMRLADNGIVTCSMTLFTFRLANESISTAKNSKASLSAKYKATKLFYNEHRLWIDNYIPLNDDEAHLISSIRNNFPRLIRKNKIRSQLKTSSFRTIITTLNEGTELDCINALEILAGCRYPIRNSLKSLLRLKKKR